ncbi:cystatin-B-like [Dendropsophus ebraccatus]|uniref:cystatin-B-like n=1 Tax=Dendropsophus ebraccatus TaxID=150705 RepID=UPI003831C33E
MDVHTKCGAVGDVNPADAEVQEVVQKVKAAFEAKSGVNTAEFKAVTFATQVVAGTNYFVKVSLGGGHFCHLRIYQPLPYTKQGPRLDGYELDKTEQDTISYF